MKRRKDDGRNPPTIGWATFGGKPEKRLRQSLRNIMNPTAIRMDTVQDLIAELRVQYDRVRERAKFLKLKESELRPDDEISLFAMIDAKQECHLEQSLLAGHAHMVREIIIKKGLTVDLQTKRLLSEITKNVSKPGYYSSFLPWS